MDFFGKKTPIGIFGKSPKVTTGAIHERVVEITEASVRSRIFSSEF